MKRSIAREEKFSVHGSCLPEDLLGSGGCERSSQGVRHVASSGAEFSS